MSKLENLSSSSLTVQNVYYPTPKPTRHTTHSALYSFKRQLSMFYKRFSSWGPKHVLLYWYWWNVRPEPHTHTHTHKGIEIH